MNPLTKRAIKAVGIKTVDVEVCIAYAHDVGNCNSCNGSYKGKIWKIRIGGMVVRACNPCLTSMLKQIGDKEYE